MFARFFLFFTICVSFWKCYEGRITGFVVDRQCIIKVASEYITCQTDMESCQESCINNNVLGLGNYAKEICIQVAMHTFHKARNDYVPRISNFALMLADFIKQCCEEPLSADPIMDYRNRDNCETLKKVRKCFMGIPSLNQACYRYHLP